MPNPSDSIPTFEQYKKGAVSISKDTQKIIVGSTVEDKNISNTKLSELTTQIESEISKLQSMCSPYSTLTRLEKENCGSQMSNHIKNRDEFIKLHHAVIGMRSLGGGSRRKTMKGRRKNKSRRNRKSRR
jgi:hypothetical protein